MVPDLAVGKAEKQDLGVRIWDFWKKRINEDGQDRQDIYQCSKVFYHDFIGSCLIIQLKRHSRPRSGMTQFI